MCTPTRRGCQIAGDLLSRCASVITQMIVPLQEVHDHTVNIPIKAQPEELICRNKLLD